MARQADDANIMAEVLAAELGAHAQLAGMLQELALQVRIAEGLSARHCPGWAGIQISGRGQLDGFQGQSRPRCRPITTARW